MTGSLRASTLAAVLALLASPAFAQEVMLRGTLTSGNVVSATESPATGEVAAVLEEDGTLQLDLVFAGLENGATGAALHTGEFNENGPMLAPLDIDTGSTSGRIQGAEIALTPLDAAAVRDGRSYVVVSTITNPDGAIRAQLLPQPVRLEDMPPAIDRFGASPIPTLPRIEDPTPMEEEEEED